MTHPVVFHCLCLSLPPSPSPGQSQILNWNVLLPHKLFWPLNYSETGSLGRKEEEGGGYSLPINGTSRRDRGRMLSYMPCDHKAERSFSGSDILCFQMVWWRFSVFWSNFGSYQMWASWIRKVHSTAETADCIEDTVTLHSKHITWQSPNKKTKIGSLLITAQISYIHKNITVKIPSVIGVKHNVMKECYKL